MDVEIMGSIEAQAAADSLQRISLEEEAVLKDEPASAAGDIILDEENTVKKEPPKGNNDEDDLSSDDEMPPLLESTAIKKNDSDTDADDPAADPEPPTQEEADALMIAATSHKEEGNDHFKLGTLELAARSYRRGCQSIKRLLPRDKVYENVDEQITSLHLALHTNLSMVLFQLKRHKQSVAVATTALSVKPDHVKALYRRAVARRALNDLDKAKVDLVRALQLDATNAACRKELAALQSQVQAAKENGKRSLAKAFSGKLANDKTGLYQDKATEEQKKKELSQQRKLQEQEQYKKRKQEWEDECVKRMSKDEPAVSFEDWEKEQKEQAKAEQKEAEKKRKEEEKRRKEALRAKRAQESKAAEESDDDDLTEKELAMMRGYKITKDGHKTSYFTRELPDNAAKQYHDISPKRLESNHAVASPSAEAAAPIQSTVSGTAGSTSAWNAAGTWEEKDTTTWCTDQLKKRLEETTVGSDKFDVDIVEVKSITGHGSVVFAAGKRRYIFEYEVEMVFEIKTLESNQLVASGTVCLPDIESTSHDELEVAFGPWKKKPLPGAEELAMDATARLSDELRMQVQCWVKDFNKTY